MPAPALPRFIKRRYGGHGLVAGLVTGLTDSYVNWRVADDCRRFQPYLPDHSSILDIGTGSAMVYKMLRERGYDITGIDVADLSVYPEIKPIIYNGSQIDFKDKSFDAAILDRVLHHCGENQEAVLRESLRAAKRVLIIEDVYFNGLEKLMVAFNDSMCNWEWHKHYYRDTKGWKSLLESLGAKVIHQQTWREVPQWTVYIPHMLLVADSV
jgi:SAM-dependent methyltransferase